MNHIWITFSLYDLVYKDKPIRKWWKLQENCQYLYRLVILYPRLKSFWIADMKASCGRGPVPKARLNSDIIIAVKYLYKFVIGYINISKSLVISNISLLA